MEHLNDLIIHRLDGANPDVQFFNRAYLLTMNHWSNELRVADVQLEALVHARTGWAHFWTNYSPSSGGRGASSSTDSVGGAYYMSMLPPDLYEQVNQMSALTKSLQSKVDRQAVDKTKRKWEAPVDNTKDVKGKGKNKNKGNGRGNKFKKFRGPRGGKGGGQ